MYIRTFSTAQEAKDQININQTAIVIDVLRASSVITTAIGNGAKKIKAFLTIEETIEYKSDNAHEQILLCGERNRKLIEGFDLSNSPMEYTNEAVGGKTLAMTTTNGTKAIEFAKTAGTVYIMSFLNLEAVCADIDKNCTGLDFICSGTEGRLSLDDLVCAGKAISLISRTRQCTLDDCSLLSKKYYESGSSIRELIKESVSYKGVINAGFADDIEYCIAENISNAIPIYKDGYIIAR